MKGMLAVVGLVSFATALFARAVDPIVPPIAAALAVDPATVALLSTAFSLPFAAVQPLHRGRDRVHRRERDEFSGSAAQSRGGRNGGRRHLSPRARDHCRQRI